MTNQPALHRLPRLSHLCADSLHITQNTLCQIAILRRMLSSSLCQAIALPGSFHLDRSIADLFQVGKRGVDCSGAGNIPEFRPRFRGILCLLCIALDPSFPALLRQILSSFWPASSRQPLWRSVRAWEASRRLHATPPFADNPLLLFSFFRPRALAVRHVPV
jgi:hypothetical protein